MDDKLYDTPIEAIRKNCLWCTLNSYKEIKECTVISCPLYAYRMGIRPSDETKDTLRDFQEKTNEIA